MGKAIASGYTQEEITTCKDCFHIDVCGDKHYLSENICCNFTTKVATVAAAEVSLGRWIEASNKPGARTGMKCSECGARIRYRAFYNGTHKYCHSCGARMVNGQKGGEDQ